MALARPLALSGPMGAGKSTVGAKVAARLGVDFVDLDVLIANEAGRPVSQLFAEEGEAAFRAREAAALRNVLSRDRACVIALGGGAVVDHASRRALLDRAIVVTLVADPKTLAERLRGEGVAMRPLLASSEDPAARLAAIVEARSLAYREAHARIDTAGRSIDAVADAVLAIAERDPVVVPLGERTYRVEVGRDRAKLLGDLIASLDGPAIVVTDDAVSAALGDRVERHVPMPIARVVLPSGEAHKTIDAVAKIWDAAIDVHADRKAIVIAIGGGVVGDVAGFAAATLLRGVRFVQVPTTLLAMVDASVGGKTAVDRPQGKNLVGAFHQPSGVIADVDLLATLPERQVKSGLAEVVKTALVADAAMLDAIEADIDRIARGDADALAPIVRASIAAKARIVAEDERETTGARFALNFGHTVGHALESYGGYERWTHGEAVSLGMVAALEVGVARGVTSPSIRDRTVALLARLGLPHVLDRDDVAASLPRVAHDKKRSGGRVAYVLVPAIGRVSVERLAVEELGAALLHGR